MWLYWLAQPPTIAFSCKALSLLALPLVPIAWYKEECKTPLYAIGANGKANRDNALQEKAIVGSIAIQAGYTIVGAACDASAKALRQASRSSPRLLVCV